MSAGGGQHPTGLGGPQTGSHRALVRNQEREDLVSHLQFVSAMKTGLGKLEGWRGNTPQVLGYAGLAELLQGLRVLNSLPFLISSFQRQQVRLQRAGQAGGEAAHPAAAPREGNATRGARAGLQGWVSSGDKLSLRCPLPGGGRDQGAGVGHGERGGGQDALGARGHGGHQRGAAAGHGRGHRAGQIRGAAGSVPPRDGRGAG